MSAPLAVVTPVAGATTETFIRRHVESLLPGRTVAVTTSTRAEPGRWGRDVPQLDYGTRSGGLLHRVAHRLGPVGPEALARTFFRRHGVEVLLAEYLDVATAWVPLARAWGLRVVPHAHGHDVSARLRSPEWRRRYAALADADMVVTVSEYSRRRLVDAGLAAERIRVIPYGVDVPAEPPTRAVADTVRLVAVGRLVAKKAPILLLDAFRRALDAHPGLTLDIVGAGPLRAAVDQFIMAFSLGSVVTCHGELPHEDARSLMRGAHIFVQHSVTDSDGNQEGLPLAILEAMADGLPVVATDHAGIPEAVTTGVTGWLVPEGDSKAMGHALVELARSTAGRQAYGRAGWEVAHARFNWDRQRMRLLDALGLKA